MNRLGRAGVCVTIAAGTALLTGKSDLPRFQRMRRLRGSDPAARELCRHRPGSGEPARHQGRWRRQARGLQFARPDRAPRWRCGGRRPPSGAAGLACGGGVPGVPGQRPAAPDRQRSERLFAGQFWLPPYLLDVALPLILVAGQGLHVGHAEFRRYALAPPEGGRQRLSHPRPYFCVDAGLALHHALDLLDELLPVRQELPPVGQVTIRSGLPLVQEPERAFREHIAELFAPGPFDPVRVIAGSGAPALRSRRTAGASPPPARRTSPRCRRWERTSDCP